MNPEFEKLAMFYDNLGRELFKQARKLPPGMFSGRKGALKLVAGAGAGTAAYLGGKASGKKEGEKDDVQIANRAYQAGVKRGAMAVLQRLRSMGG
ncbi:MAG: hypothetical protein ACYTBJ_05345 [Planctomycetota bacterium]|jgi:hypothetical protein